MEGLWGFPRGRFQVCGHGHPSSQLKGCRKGQQAPKTSGMTPEHAVRTGPEAAQGLGDAQVAKNSSGAEQLGPGDCPLLRASLA